MWAVIGDGSLSIPLHIVCNKLGDERGPPLPPSPSKTCATSGGPRGGRGRKYVQQVAGRGGADEWLRQPPLSPLFGQQLPSSPSWRMRSTAAFPPYFQCIYKVEINNQEGFSKPNFSVSRIIGTKIYLEPSCLDFKTYGSRRSFIFKIYSEMLPLVSESPCAVFAVFGSTSLIVSPASHCLETLWLGCTLWMRTWTSRLWWDPSWSFYPHPWLFAVHIHNRK